jgi:hypothetical protein
MAELKVKEWNDAPCGSFRYAQVKKGHALYGEIRKYRTGAVIYFAKRHPDEVFLELDAWAVDCETIRMLKAYRVQFIGILVTNGDLYLTHAESFEDRALGAVVLNYEAHRGTSPGAKGKLGARQWYLPRYAFAKRVAPPEGTLALMKIAGRR